MLGPIGIRPNEIRAMSRWLFMSARLTAGAPGEAFSNGERMVDLERSLGVAWEDAVQASIVGRDSLVMLANWVYIWGHWPVILSTAVVLYVWRP